MIFTIMRFSLVLIVISKNITTKLIKHKYKKINLLSPNDLNTSVIFFNWDIMLTLNALKYAETLSEAC